MPDAPVDGKVNRVRKCTGDCSRPTSPRSCFQISFAAGFLARKIRQQAYDPPAFLPFSADVARSRTLRADTCPCRRMFTNPCCASRSPPRCPTIETPWNSGRFSGGIGTGFLIGKNNILTNAHVVSNGRRLLITVHGSPRKYPAKVEFIAHDCDLALLSVEDFKDFESFPVFSIRRGPEPRIPGPRDRLPGRRRTAVGHPRRRFAHRLSNPTRTPAPTRTSSSRSTPPSTPATPAARWCRTARSSASPSKACAGGQHRLHHPHPGHPPLPQGHRGREIRPLCRPRRQPASRSHNPAMRQALGCPTTARACSSPMSSPTSPATASSSPATCSSHSTASPSTAPA